MRILISYDVSLLLNFVLNSPNADALQITCEKTGGRFIESSKVDVDDIVALLSQSIKSSEVRNPKSGQKYFPKFHSLSFQSVIGSQTGLKEKTKVPIYVDSSIDDHNYRIHAKVTGKAQEVILHSPSGTSMFHFLFHTLIIAL